MKKNQFFLVISIVSLLMILTFVMTSFNEDKDEVVLRFGTWAYSPAENIILDRVIDTFTRKTGIYVERETYPYNYSSIMSNKLRTNTGPDVFFVSQMDYRFWQFNGWLRNVDHLVEDPNEYYQPIRETFRTEGQFYTIPKDFASIMLYINEDMLEAAGYQADDVPRSMSEMSQFLQELQQRLPEGVTAMTIDVQLENFMAFFEKLDPIAYADFDFANSEPIRQFIVELSELLQSGALKIMNENIQQEPAGEQFRKQETAITMEGNWLYNDLNYYETSFDYRVEQLPTVKGETPMAAYFTGYGISSNTKHAEAAELFVHYLTTIFSPYIVKNISSFPVSETVAKKVLEKNKNLDDIGLAMIDGLGKEVVVGKNYHHVIYAYYFGLQLPKMLEQPEEIATFFSQAKQETIEAEKYIAEVMRLRDQRIE